MTAPVKRHVDLGCTFVEDMTGLSKEERLNVLVKLCEFISWKIHMELVDKDRRRKYNFRHAKPPARKRTRAK